MTVIQKELPIPASAQRTLRLHAVEVGHSLGTEVAALVIGYANGDYTDLEKVDDPGKDDTDVRVKFKVEDSVWEQARVRAVMDGTNVRSAVRRAALATKY